jgi:mannitol-specific phosphotransferase system IIBC component
MKSGLDIGAFVMIAPVSEEVLTQMLIALGVLIVNTILYPLVKVLIEWIKYKLKKYLPEELHDEIDLIGKSKNKEKGE